MDKLSNLEKIIGEYNSAIIAFSGGVDSTFLACIAGRILKKNLLLVTAHTLLYPVFELEEAKRTASYLKLDHRFLTFLELEIPELINNVPDHCYYCKKNLFSQIKTLADQEGYQIVFDGSNSDDEKDFRPGRKALKELGIRSPLAEAKLTKPEIRDLSFKNKLPTAQKPSYTCLASRFPYGEEITRPKLERVSRAETALHDLGFTQFRVRSHNDLAKVEFIKEEIEKAWLQRANIQAACRQAGFIYVAIDTEGYRMGAMNEVFSATSGK